MFRLRCVSCLCRRSEKSNRLAIRAWPEISPLARPQSSSGQIFSRPPSIRHRRGESVNIITAGGAPKVIRIPPPTSGEGIRAQGYADSEGGPTRTRSQAMVSPHIAEAMAFPLSHAAAHSLGKRFVSGTTARLSLPLSCRHRRRFARPEFDYYRSIVQSLSSYWLVWLARSCAHCCYCMANNIACLLRPRPALWRHPGP
jgi:hypothetical protein